MGGEMSIVGICLASYVAGLLAGQYLLLPSLPGLALCVCTFFGLIGVSRRRTPLGYLLLVLFCLLSGLLRYTAGTTPPANSAILQKFSGQSQRIEGRVLRAQERPQGGSSVDLGLQRVGEFSGGAVAGLVLRLYVRQTEVVPAPGSRLVFRARIRPVRNFSIPGEFDYARHMAYRRIWHSAYLADDRGLAVFHAVDAGWRGHLARIRRAGLRVIEQLPQQDALLLKALLLGEKGAMPQELRRRLAESGISHLFAISGLHFGLLAGLGYLLLKFIYCRSRRLLLWQPPVRVLWLPLMPLLFGYMLLSGDALATRRAFFILLCVALLALLRRRTEPLQLLMSLALLFLLYEPLALWQPSFLLSFCGAAGILCWHRPIFEKIRIWPIFFRAPAQLLTTSLAASLATLPAVVYFFHLYAPAGLLSNLVAVPLVSLVALPLGLFGLLVSVLVPAAGLLLMQVAAAILRQVISFAAWVSSLPGFRAQEIFLTRMELVAVALFCLALLLVLRWRHGLVLLLPALLLGGSSAPGVNGIELVLFSVGQGESMLLRAEGKTLLIDGGGLRSDNFDVGERLLAPALGRLGVKHLDAVLLSHNHPDHSRGLVYILEHFPVGEFWSLPGPAAVPAELVEVLTRRKVPRRSFAADTWGWPAPGGLRALAIYSAAQRMTTENDRSLCLYLPSAAGGLLLTADIEAAGVAALLDSSIPGPVGLLKVPHHGSAGADPERLLATLDPSTLLVSAGYENRYHFPSATLMAAAQQKGLHVWRTDLDGTLRVRVQDDKWKVEHWSRGLFR